jgi:hypothetical protein
VHRDARFVDAKFYDDWISGVPAQQGESLSAGLARDSGAYETDPWHFTL